MALNLSTIPLLPPLIYQKRQRGDTVSDNEGYVVAGVGRIGEFMLRNYYNYQSTSHCCGSGYMQYPVVDCSRAVYRMPASDADWQISQEPTVGSVYSTISGTTMDVDAFLTSMPDIAEFTGKADWGDSEMHQYSRMMCLNSIVANLRAFGKGSIMGVDREDAKISGLFNFVQELTPVSKRRKSIARIKADWSSSPPIRSTLAGVGRASGAEDIVRERVRHAPATLEIRKVAGFRNPNNGQRLLHWYSFGLTHHVRGFNSRTYNEAQQAVLRKYNSQTAFEFLPQNTK